MKDFMENVKKFVNDLVDIINTTLPVGWVFACYDGATKYLVASDFIRFLGHVFCACLISLILIWFGLWMTGQTITKDKAYGLSLNRWATLGIEVLVLLVVTANIIR